MSGLLQFPDRRLEQDEAATWIARLDRGLRGTEREQLCRWLAESTRHRESLFELAQLWDRLEMLSELAELFPLKEGRVGSRRMLARPVVPVLAALLALVAILFAFHRHGNYYGAPDAAGVATHQITAPTSEAPVHGQALFASTYATAIGERLTVDLPDHSNIQLNTHTALEIEFTPTARLVKITRGEASFQVAKDPARIFTVRVGGFDFNAVGTAFDIRSDSSHGVRLLVTQGRVRVHRSPPQAADGQESALAAGLNDSTDVEVEANKQVVIRNSTESIDSLEPTQVAAATAWQRGILIFQGTPLEEVVAEVGRYSTTRFVIADPELGRVPVSGYFKVGDLAALSAALEHNFGINVQKKGDLITLSALPSK